MEIKSKFMISEENPAVLKNWHGANPIFSSSINYFYQDNTIQKAVLMKEKLELSMRQLSVNRKLLHLQTDIRNNAKARRQIQENWDSLVKLKIKNHKLENRKINSAAITIQRHVRGFLARLQNEDAFIQIVEKKSETLVAEASYQALTIMLNLGVVLVPATIIIQKAYKRYQFKKKILILKLCYESYMNEKREAADYLVKKAIRIIINYRCLKALKFLKTREIKLELIKRRLAILKVKNYWKERRFTFRIIKDKILRVKRRQAAMQNREAYSKYLNSLGGKVDKKLMRKESNVSDEEKNSDSDKPDQTAGDLLDEEEYLEAQRIKEMIERRLRDKINKGKVSYGIKLQEKQQMVLPLMQEKALGESPSYVSYNLMNFTASVFAKGRTLSRDKKLPSRSTLIGSPPPYEHKRFNKLSFVPHMKSLYTPEPEPKAFSPPKGIDYAEFMESTVSFNKKIYKPQEKSPKKRKYIIVPLTSNLVVPTIAHTIKQTQKKIIEKKKKWSFGLEKEKYLVGINNNSYSPIEWKPVKLNKNILIKTDYGKKFYNYKSSSNFETRQVNRTLTPDLPLLPRNKNILSLYSNEEIN